MGVLDAALLTSYMELPLGAQQSVAADLHATPARIAQALAALDLA
jgi:hypothetical protein